MPSSASPDVCWLLDRIRADFPNDRSEVYYFEDLTEWEWHASQEPRYRNGWTELLPVYDDERGVVYPHEVEEDIVFGRISILGMPPEEARKLALYATQLERFLARNYPSEQPENPIPKSGDPFRGIALGPFNTFPACEAINKACGYALGRSLLWAMGVLKVRHARGLAAPAVTLLCLAVETYVRERQERQLTPPTLEESPVGPEPPPSDGDLVDNGRAVYCQGLKLRLTTQLRELLARILKAPGIEERELCRVFGYTDLKHLSVRLNALRERLPDELKKLEAPFRVEVWSDVRKVYSEIRHLTTT